MLHAACLIVGLWPLAWPSTQPEIRPATSRAGAAHAAALNSALATIAASDLKQHVDVLASDAFEGRGAGTRGGRAAAGYVVQAVERLGLRPAGESGGYFQSFSNMRNILAVLEGSDPNLSRQYIVIGAHYDHVGYGSARNSYGPTGMIHNGADDNASGVAMLLEVAEAFCKMPQAPRRSILFAFWDGEENGLLGSRHWTDSPTIPLSQITAAFNVDMVGRLRGQMEVFGSRTAAGWRTLIARHNRQTDVSLAFPWKIEADSDHYSFLEHRIPVVMFHTGLHPEYHRPSDDVDLINAPGMERIGRLLFQVAMDLGEQEQAIRFREQSLNETEVVQQRQEAVDPRAAPPRLGVGWKPLESGGVEVTRVSPESSAARAGLRVGDQILKLNQRSISQDFAARIVAAPSQSTLQVARPEEGPIELKIELSGPPQRLGVSWRRDEGDPEPICVSSIVRDSAAEAAGLRVGDRVQAVDQQPVGSDAEFLRRIAGADALVLTVERNGMLRDVTVNLP